jgi:hypothetical protein
VEAASGLVPGDVVDVTGVLKTINGEKMLTDATHSKTGSEAIPAPLGLCGQAAMSLTPSPVGLMVKVWGKVLSVGEGYCLLDSGLGIWSDGIAIAEGDLVASTGVLCRELVDGKEVTVIRVPVGGEVAVLE